MVAMSIFLAFGTSELQSWAIDDPEETKKEERSNRIDSRDATHDV